MPHIATNHSLTLTYHDQQREAQTNVLHGTRYAYC